MNESFDVEQFARDTVKSIEWGDDDDEVLEQRVMRLEEILAARWPRRLALRRRLAREIRGSVASYHDSFIPRRDFAARRAQWAAEQAEIIRRERRRER